MKKIFIRSLAALFLIVLIIPTALTHAYTFTRSLDMSSQGEDVRQLQFFLSKEGLFKGYVSGSYGALTVDAVRQYQLKNGLPGVGVVGARTLALLNSGEEVLGATATATVDEKADGSTCTSRSVKTTLKLDDISQDVVTMQEQLDCFGYTDGANDGYYGRQTMASVAEFQKSRGIAGDGRFVDEKTLNAMNIVLRSATNDFTITLNKVVYGGSATPSAWTLGLTAGGIPLVSGPTGTTYTIPFGTYQLTESGPAGYTASQWVCTRTENGLNFPVTNGYITTVAGDTINCTITNNFGSQSAPTIKLVKHVVGGNLTPQHFAPNIDGVQVQWEVAYPVAPNMLHTIGESTLPAMYTSGQWNGISCTNTGIPGAGTGSVTVANNGQNIVCEITNTTTQQGITQLTLTKDVANDNGSSSAPTSWTLTATNGSTIISGTTPVTSPPAGIPAGTYTLTESGPTGFNLAITCSGAAFVGNQVTIPQGASASCLFFNDDIGPSLTLDKVVIGGPAQPTDWTIKANNPSHSYSIQGQGHVPADPVMAQVGTYTLSEFPSNPTSTVTANYTASAWTCTNGVQVSASSQIILGPGQTTTCTITNTYILPPNPAHLKLQKNVTNNNGGTALPTAWTLTAAGPTPLSGTGSVLRTQVTPGTYTLNESSSTTGYAQGSWSCTGQTSQSGSTIVISAGDDVECEITNDDIAPSLTLKKLVSGQGSASAWTLRATGNLSNPTNISGTTPVTSGTNFKADTYTLSETGPAGYTAGPWSCTNGVSVNSNDEITLPLAKVTECTITNTYVPLPAHLKLEKNVVNDDGGTLPASSWTLTAAGPTPLSGAGGVPRTQVLPGTYVLSESLLPPGYMTIDWGCTGATSQTGNTIVISAGDDVECTVENNDLPGTLTVIKHVINNNGGSATANDWAMNVNASNPSNASFPGAEAPGIVLTLDAGSYTVTESGGPSGYVQTSAVGCSGTIGLTEQKTCTITNDDVAPSLTLVKSVQNGGPATASAWTLTATGPTPISGNGIATSGPTFKKGTYTLNETGPTGYTAGNWSCTNGVSVNSNDQITLDLGDTTTCTITNTYVPPAYLTLVKLVINNDGGNELPRAWTLTAAGPTPLSGAGGVPRTQVLPGTYTLDESTGPAGYARGDWSCTGASSSGDHVTITQGDDVVCTIENDDIAPLLRLIKEVDNGETGATFGPSDWTLSATGGTPPDRDFTINGASGTAHTVYGNTTYTLGEVGPNGYQASAWNCTAGTLVGNRITVPLATHVVCTIRNSAIAPVLILQKTIINDNGGTATIANFTPKIDNSTTSYGNTVVWSVQTPGRNTVTVGSHFVTEDNISGYTPSPWGGDCKPFGPSGPLHNAPRGSGVVTLALGDVKTCTITNNDLSGTLTIVKTVVNDNGGTATTADFQGQIDGRNAPWGIPQTVTPGTHSVGEITLPGYTPSQWGGDCAEGNTVYVGPGEDKICTITNDDEQAYLRLEKTVDNGTPVLGNASPSSFQPYIDGATSVNGVPVEWSHDIPVNPGLHGVSESTLSGYVAGSWTVPCSRLLNSTVVTIGLGEHKTCRITNTFTPATLSLTKIVNNCIKCAYQPQLPTAWTVTASRGSTTVLSGAGSVPSTAVVPGTYTISESQGPANFTASYSCTKNGGVPIAGNTITLASGDNVNCTIINTFTPPPAVCAVDITAVPGNVLRGSSSMLTWTASGCAHVYLNGSSVASQMPPPGQSTGSLTSTRTYTLIGTNTAGCTSGSCVASSDQVTIGVYTPTCTVNSFVTPQATSINSGTMNVTVSWTTSGCNRVTLQSLSGTRGILPNNLAQLESPLQTYANAPLSGSYTFTRSRISTAAADNTIDISIIAANAVDTASKVNTVTITNPVTPAVNQCQINSLTANPAIVTSAIPSTIITWALPNGCTATGGYWNRNSSGILSFVPVTFGNLASSVLLPTLPKSSSFVLTFTNSQGSALNEKIVDIDKI